MERLGIGLDSHAAYLAEPKVRLPEVGEEELHVVQWLVVGAAVQRPERRRVGGQHLLLREEGILPPAHCGRHLVVVLSQLFALGFARCV